MYMFVQTSLVSEICIVIKNNVSRQPSINCTDFALLETTMTSNIDIQSTLGLYMTSTVVAHSKEAVRNGAHTLDPVCFCCGEIVFCKTL
jgi:hypothetical protein